MSEEELKSFEDDCDCEHYIGRSEQRLQLCELKATKICPYTSDGGRRLCGYYIDGDLL